MLFPGIILVSSYALNNLIDIRIRQNLLLSPKILKSISIMLLTIIVVSNSIYFIIDLNKKPAIFKLRVNASKEIITLAEGKEYNLKWGRVDQKLERFTSNYEYLIWWLKGPVPSAQNQGTTFVINEYDNEIKIIKK
jgi:hypothetical protein